MTEHCSVKSHLTPRIVLFMHNVGLIIYGFYYFCMYQKRLRQLKRSKVRRMVNWMLILMIIAVVIMLIPLLMNDEYKNEGKKKTRI